jgi:Zn-dependent M32 family carboxypeptidase
VQAYGKLCARLKEVDELDGIQALLSWDERVMMVRGAGFRA